MEPGVSEPLCAHSATYEVGDESVDADLDPVAVLPVPLLEAGMEVALA